MAGTAFLLTSLSFGWVITGRQGRGVFLTRGLLLRLTAIKLLLQIANSGIELLNLLLEQFFSGSSFFMKALIVPKLSDTLMLLSHEHA